MQIIQHNPYRTLGLLVGATAAGQRRQTTRLQRFIEADIEPEEDFSFPVLGEFVRTVDLVNDAESKLNLNRDKMNAALFWFYKGNSITDEPAFDAMKSGDISEAVNIWIKLTSNGEISQRNASAFNNLGTLYLSGAFGHENTKDTQIEQGVSFKLEFFESDYIVDLKILAADETFQTTKKELQLHFLNKIQAEIEKSDIITLNKLLEIVTKQDFTAKDDYLKGFAQQAIEDIERSIEESKAKRKVKRDGAIGIGKALLKQTSDKLKQVKTILGPSDLSYSSIADKVANEVLQCSVEYFNYHQKLQSDSDYFKPTLELAKSTELIAAGKLTKDRINDNLSTLENMKYQEINQAINLLSSIHSAYLINYTNIMAEVNKMRLGRNQTINWGKVNKMIEKSIDWDKAIINVTNAIPKQHINKIKEIEDNSKLVRYKELVDFFLSKLDYTQKAKVEYLYFWKTENPISFIKYLGKSIPVWFYWILAIVIILLLISAIWGKEGIEVVLAITGFFGIMFFIGWLQNVGR